MSQFDRLLVPFDFSEPAIDALRFAAQWARLHPAEIVVLHKVRVPNPRAHPEVALNRLMADLEPHLENRIGEILATENISAEIRIGTQPLGDMLESASAGAKRPLLMMSRHGWSGKHKGIGSTARKLLQVVKTPAWLVGESIDVPDTALVAVGLDEQTDRLIETAKRLGDDGVKTQRLVNVRDPRLETGYLSEIGWPPAVSVFDDLRKAAADELEGMAERLRKKGIKTDSAVESGPIAVRLAESAEHIGARLIVCGKHTRGSLETIFLGSTADDLARHWPEHLLLVP